MKWIFAYGSLIWRPGFEWRECHRARAEGWVRGFWPGSPDHRGTPSAPGRVVTIVQNAGGFCDGVVYGIEPASMDDVLHYLDDRESGGYERADIEVILDNGERQMALTYVGYPHNPNYLGPAPDAEMVQHIRKSVGPSGANLDYLMSLHEALHRWAIEDVHVDCLVAQLKSS